MKPFFADQYGLLAASDCSEQGFNVFFQNPCDPYNRTLAYSRVWLTFSYLGLHARHNTIFGIAIISSFLITTVLSVKPRKFNELIISALLLSSPAVMLGVERGNSDLIIYTLCVGGVYFITQGNLLLKIISYFIFILAFLLKFYPIASLILLINHIKTKKVFYYISTSIIILISIYIYVTFNDLIMIKNNIQIPYDFFLSFGSEELIRLLNIKVNTLYVSLPIIFMTIIIGFYISEILKNINNDIDTRVIYLFLAGSANLCLCFFININYSYRCVYFLCCLPYFFRLKEHNQSVAIKSIVYAFYFFMLSVVWAEFFIYWVGDPAVMSIFKISMMDAIKNIQIVKHASSWGASLTLLVFFFAIIKSSLVEKLSFNVKSDSTPKGLRT